MATLATKGIRMPFSRPTIRCIASTLVVPSQPDPSTLYAFKH